MYVRDDYEYRVGYQYKDGMVSFTESLDEQEVPLRLDVWRTKNRFLLLTDPWIERRRIQRWERYMS